MVKFKNTITITGLNDEEVLKSRSKHGTNELPPPEIESFWDKLKENFEDPIIRILLVALGITLGLALLGYADWVEGLGIFIAVFLATFVSTWSEYKNENSFRTLQEQASKVQNNVFRNGSPIKISAADIVVGDTVLLQAGDKIPADGQLVFGELQVNQASLTGEQVPVRKLCGTKEPYQPKDKTNFYDERLCFRGSVVDDGEAIMEVKSVGKTTEYGQLYTELADTETRESPLQVKLSNLADAVATFGYFGATAIAISFLFKQFVIDQHYDWQAITTYVSFANWQVALHDVVTSVILAIIVIVVAVPEGLPMMIAIVLSLNMRKLLKAKVLVRKLLGIETAGSLDTLFVDKTGTLTKGVFIPQVFISGGGRSYKDHGELTPALSTILDFGLRESTSAVIGDNGPVGGNASDRAMLGFLDKESLKERIDCSMQKEILFNSERKFSAVQLALGKNKPSFLPNSVVSIVKGAPDLVLPACNSFFTEDGKKEKLTKSTSDIITEKLNQISTHGTRVIAICYKDAPLADDQTQMPNELTLIGVMGIMDEIRKESKPAIELAKKAGIHVVMITGDRKETAVAVADELGLLEGGKTVLTSTQLHTLSDAQLQQMIPNVSVIARALPTDKSRLVRICQGINRVVGMTGDGVNDSAALKKADVGFAMGSGSEVAKEAADIVILDDNFQSLTQAVLYGRTIFKSIRKFIVFQSTVNCASLLIVFMGPFLGFDFPLTLIQLLWVNLVMDTLAAMAFGGEPALKRYMHETPIKRDAPIISRNMWSAIIVNGMFIAAVCITTLKSTAVRELFVRAGKPNEPVFLTAFFAFFIFLTAFNAFNARTPKLNIFNHILENRGFVLVISLIFVVQVTFTYVGGSFLRTVGLTLSEWALVIGASMVIIPFDFVRKLITKSLFGHRRTLAEKRK
jgi:calcium-translocating P-type ATPase